MFDWVGNPEIWASFLALSAMEIVLGIDNIVFISVLISRLPEARRQAARRLGLGLALIFRILFLTTIVWLTRLTAPIFTVFEIGVSWRDIILIGGGLFLLVKATLEIHHMVEGAEQGAAAKTLSVFAFAIAQIIVIDIVFSIDSVITAVGMARRLPVMIAAVLVAVAVMYAASIPVARFVASYPTTKMLALSFLMLVGVALIADGFHFHIPRGYLYFAMAFAVGVEFLNVVAIHRRRGAHPPTRVRATAESQADNLAD